MELNSKICNFADDNTINSSGKNLNEIATNFEIDFGRLLKWLAKNGKVASPKKFLLMFLGLNIHRGLRLNIGGNKISATDCGKLLGVEIDNKLKFDKHIKILCSKVNKNINAFSILHTYISRDQALLICNEVILSNFIYCPFVLMLCDKSANKEIDRTHNRVLRMLYEDYECSFEILLTRCSSVCIHVKNLKKLMIEI